MTPVVLLGAEHLKGKPFNLETDLGLFVFLAIFAYMATALFGVPAFYLFRIRRWTNILVYVLAGLLVGLIVSVMLNAWLSSFDSLDLGLHLSRMVAGGSSALMFRMVSGGKFEVSSAPSHGET
jgi:hypothetical protein